MFWRRYGALGVANFVHGGHVPRRQPEIGDLLHPHSVMAPHGFDQSPVATGAHRLDEAAGSVEETLVEEPFTAA